MKTISRVLIVDDKTTPKTRREVFDRCYSQPEFHFADNVSDAMSLSESHKYDLIFVDMSLDKTPRGEYGLSLLFREKHPGASIIATSAESNNLRDIPEEIFSGKINSTYVFPGERIFEEKMLEAGVAIQRKKI